MSDPQAYYHGTKVDLKLGDLIAPGHAYNYGKRKQAAFVYLAAMLDAAIWGSRGGRRRRTWQDLHRATDGIHRR